MTWHERVGRVEIAVDERGDIAQFEILPLDEDANRGWRALMLAPTLEICRAFLRGESVPLDQLDPEWVRRLGLRL